MPIKAFREYLASQFKKEDTLVELHSKWCYFPNVEFLAMDAAVQLHHLIGWFTQVKLITNVNSMPQQIQEMLQHDVIVEFWLEFGEFVLCEDFMDAQALFVHFLLVIRKWPCMHVFHGLEYLDHKVFNFSW